MHYTTEERETIYWKQVGEKNTLTEDGRNGKKLKKLQNEELMTCTLRQI